ncbi:protein dachsous [Anthonomus grandis grandis]|uniref:protein dachsous n=1 Tax=Anthonomus grandis grandis TaxID=2921223 RepID=UPI002165BE34|nr:protein dachsous [Anthonomus grandis grandis]
MPITHTMAVLCCIANLLLLISAAAEHVRDLEVSEGVPVGTKIGFIGDGASPDSGPPYLIVPVGAAVDIDLSIDQTTGEIKTRVPLDRETRASYSLVAIPMSGDNVKVVVKILDENDNAPTFPSALVNIEFPENTPRDVKRTLPPARDLDLDVYNTQRYNIISGNINNTFRLSSHRETDGVLYLDLQINGFLDRETCEYYSLVIEALDGGTPPLRGEMTVNITIQDVNDNPPIFNQSRYFASVQENSTIGTSVLQVLATDADVGDNAQIEYSINRRQSDKDMLFIIDSTTGVIAVNKPLDFELKELHELVVVAKDHGLQPLEATTFVSIKVIDVNDNQPTINVIFLSEDATPKISESAQPGEFVARISVHDPDSKTEYANVNVTLSGGEGHFGLSTRDNIIYLVIVSLPLDRELQPNYTLNVIATDQGTPPLHASRTINLLVTDVNDNAPEFDQDVYEANVMEVSDPGTSVIQVYATDKDEGNNSAITYSLMEPSNSNMNWFQIDARSGLITTRAHVDCETEPLPQLTVIATDNGFPPLSSSATVLVTIHDVNDNEPIFDQSFYNVSVAENETEGRCILKVSATDPDCGVNAVVNYTLGDGFEKLREFKVRSDTGEICISAPLDYETRNVYEFPVIATDRGGLSTTAMVKIQVTDVNDNRPVFYPPEYNVSLRDGGSSSSSSSSPVVVVSATDADSGKFGAVTYQVVAGNELGIFRIDRNSGAIFVNRPHQLSTRSHPYHRLNISATDGGSLKSLKDAEVFISVIDSAQKPPIFDQPRYVFAVLENVKKEFVVGHVKATVNNNGKSNVRYSIYSGDPDGLFRIDPITGAIKVSGNLDHETRASVLLNVQATSGNPPVYGHTQVNIDINDVNDNTPEFESPTVRISIPENTETGVALYAAHALDKDGGSNGLVRYRLANSGADLFKIDPKEGHLTLTRQLDYESVQRHTLIITATDMGIPPLSANLTVLVEVQDMNDNAPVFEKSHYSLSVLESLTVNSQITQFTAVDADTGNNARITYRLIASNASRDPYEQVFGIFPNSGWLYLKGNLDREVKDQYNLVVAAKDNGLPPQTATAQVSIEILDINDNDPVFSAEDYAFKIEENLARGTLVGRVRANDADTGINAAIRYSLIPGNSSFAINAVNGEITTKDILDRESKETYDLVAEARDQGHPSRSTRVSVKITVTDVNDNAPVIVDPQEDVVSVREEQNPLTEVVRIRAIDADKGYNSSITYSLLKDSDGLDTFSIHPITGLIRTKAVLDHEEKTIYRIGVVATDGGSPPKQSVRMLRVEVLDLNDNRPTFTSSSLAFTVREDAKIGQVVGSVATTSLEDEENIVPDSTGSHISYTLTTSSSAFEIERNTGKIVVAQELNREEHAEYKLEIRALDVRAMNNPQSSAISVKIQISDANDNAPKWPKDPVVISLNENTEFGTTVYNFVATDLDSDENGDVRYSLESQYPNGTFSIDALTGTLTLISTLDYERFKEHLLVIKANDQASNVSERLSSYVTTKVIVNDFNDNTPKFILPQSSTAFITEGTSVGMKITNILAIDEDSGDNGRVTYILSNSNDASYFSLGYDTGVLTLAKPLVENRKSYMLNISATDHGKPTRQANLKLKLLMQDSTNTFQKLLEPEQKANVMENAGVGTLVTQVNVREMADAGGNISFFIPPGVADDTFEISPTSGKVYTKKPLDRETIETYSIPVYVTEYSALDVPTFDKTILTIAVMDINDQAPRFQAASCRPLSIPENSETSIFHTVIAHDSDSGPNGQISYSITSGNIRNKFGIDSKTGELTAKPLDRESNVKFVLTVTAQDHGTPSMQAFCNVTVFVEDQNDNDPKFDLSKYSTTMPEDISVDTSIMKVHASDADFGLNAKIVYFLANESQWLFRIDNKTGIITTAGHFDRERKSEYNFMVVATDSGKYNARSTKVPVTVYVKDVNDNKPIFSSYPFNAKVSAYIQPGQNILKVTAKDVDEGTNGEIVYNLMHEGNYGKFRINPNTGVLSATQSLASSNGKVIYLNVVATDKGNPPKSSTGLIELIVGDVPSSSIALRFQNATYDVTVPENTEQFRDVVQVTAVRTDGRKQKIFYSFGTGNEENIFTVGAESGVIQVRDPRNLDYELFRTVQLVVEAKTEGSPNLHGYCNVVIRLTDENDNAPKFTQQQYTASVWEGDRKGTFVLQVIASDADDGPNSRILYHIVDGNHDNAFKIEPAFSGIVRTNTVLDREIRDNYRLTIIATDEGNPQMTGTTRVRINVVDVNDNQPTFPPPRTVKIPENTEPGSLIASLTANDVDTFPELTYGFASNVDKDFLDYFSVDRFSGNVFLKKRLDFEVWQECRLKIIASDTAHIAETVLTVEVVDVNDNRPEFSRSSYEANMPVSDTTSSASLIEILTVNATDADSGKNSELIFSIVNPTVGFSVGSADGIVRVNTSNISLITQDVYLTIKAEDRGEPALHNLVALHVKNSKRMETNYGFKKEYRISVVENMKIGSSVINLSKPTNQGSSFVILEGNVEKHFDISNPSGALILVKPLDRELQDEYDLTVSIDGGSSLVTHIVITVEDFNDNTPVFNDLEYTRTISENLPVGASVEKLMASDGDLPGSPNSEIVFDITSGNLQGSFHIDSQSGIVYVNKTLDYDKGESEFHLVVRACDKGAEALCSLALLTINIQDENDNSPIFPFMEYMESVGENEAVGTAVFTAHATDLDKSVFGQVKYSFVDSRGLENSWKLFSIDPESGLVTTATVFDYEQRNRYSFAIKAADTGGQSSTVKVFIEIEGKDEFYPQFTERTYKFPLATSVALPVGYIVGHVLATDKDKGPDGRVLYQLTTQNAYFKINRTTGAVLLKRKFDQDITGREISLVVTAGSGKQGSLTNMTVVEIELDPLGDPGTNLAINQGTLPQPQGGMSDWALGLVISIALLLIIFGAVFVYLHMRNKRNRKMNKPNLSSETVSTSNNYVDPSAFDTIQIRGVPQMPQGQNQFAPPKYDEIPPYGAGGGGGHAGSSNSGAATTSELSVSEQSGSSGRGSAEDGEDGEDEEIRMINEGQRGNDSDSLSAVSVRNTQEYLARLGIVDNSGAHPQVVGRLCNDPRAGSSKEMHHHQGVPLDSLHMFDEEAAHDNDITNLIYAKLNDVTGSDRASSTDDAAGVSGPTMDHVMAISYGEVPNVSHQPSMNGSLSSIVHSEEELAGSYNWDYLLDWGPQYQPLAHVFSEIARLKDDNASVHSGASGTSSVRSKISVAAAKNVPPPHITNVAPRAIALPILNPRASQNHHQMGHNQMMMLPRSPINHDTSAAMSPSFSPSLSPLATKSPSISPLVAPGLAGGHHVMTRQSGQNRNKSVVDTELRI